MFKKVNKFKDEFSSLKKNTGFYLVVKNKVVYLQRIKQLKFYYYEKNLLIISFNNNVLF